MCTFGYDDAPSLSLRMEQMLMYKMQITALLCSMQDRKVTMTASLFSWQITAQMVMLHPSLQILAALKYYRHLHYNPHTDIAIVQ